MDNINTTHNTQNIELDAAELGNLFTTYLNNTMSKCVFTYFIQEINDEDIKSIAEESLKIANNCIDRVKAIYQSVNHPIPQGFTAEDVNTNASKLFSDTFVLSYLRFNSHFALLSYSAALVTSARADVRTFFSDCVLDTRDLYNKVQDLLLSKGLFVRPPSIPIPDKLDFVHKQSYLSGFLGDKRPVNAVEIGNIYAAIETNVIGSSLALGFSQVTKDRKIKDHCIKGMNIAKDNIETFSKLLEKDFLNAPTSWNISVTTSTESPFSDKLISFHMSALSAYGIARYGLSASQCFRSDVTLSFVKAAASASMYGKDWVDIILDNAWLERIPEAADRKELIGI
jgi:hypothetical protein